MKILAAEATLAFHVVNHHQSHKSCDCSIKLYRKLFSDSEIASNIFSARTKTEAIDNNVLAPNSVSTALKRIENENISYIGVCTDGSNHGNLKIFPVLIQYFDKEYGTQLRLIELKSLNNEKSENICNLIFTTLQNYNLKSKCIAFTADNCNTNFGGLRRKGQNNVFFRLQDVIEKELIGIGCPAHILHNCIQHAIDGLPINIESLIMKIYNYFSVYTIRNESLKDFCDIAEIEYRKLLSHFKTRWLSLFPCIHRVLQMYPALKSYFQLQKYPPVLITSFFENPLNESYLWFVHSLMNVFHSTIEKIEKEKNNVIEIMDILESVENILLERKSEQFLPLKVKEILKINSND